MNIYVGNLSYDTSEDDIKVAFSAFGNVSEVRLITDRYSGRSKGFAFVEMPEAGEAESSIQGLNGTSLEGRTLTVNEARPREQSNDGNRGGSRPY
jgi:cold-inducible RNA-binding protein